MKKNKKLKNSNGLAFLIVPPMVPVFMTPLFFMFGGRELAQSGLAASAVFGFFVLGVPTSYIAVLVLGLPVFRLLKRFNQLSYFSMLISGLVCSILAFIIFLLVFNEPIIHSSSLGFGMLIGISGALCSLIFAFISEDVKKLI